MTLGTIDYDNAYFWIKAQPHVMMRFKHVFKKVAPGQYGRIGLSNTPENCRDLDWFLSRFPMEMSNRTVKVLKKGVRAHKEHENIVARMLAGVGPRSDFPLAKPAREYQRIAADLAIQTSGLLLADDVGLGKTLVGIAVLTIGAHRPGLVVTLANVMPQQWQEAFAEFAPHLRTHVIASGSIDSITARDYAVLSGIKESRRGQLSLPEPVPDVLIMNYHKLCGWADALAGFIRGVVFDEAQELRRAESYRYQAAKQIASKARLRLALTATPIYNYGAEIFNVIDIVSPGALGTWSEFAQEWCYGHDRTKARIKHPATFGAYVRGAGLMLRRTREEVGRELPPLMSVPEFIDCDQDKLDDIQSPARKLAEIILARNATRRGEQMQAAEQLSNLVRQATGIAKAPYVAAFVRMLIETGKKVVLYGWHREVYAIWLEELADLNPVMFTGSESAKQKQAAKDAFMSGESHLMIISLRAGAGVDGLQTVCHTAVFGELDWSPGVHEQCCGRVYRDGQEQPVMAYYLLAQHGSDPIVADVLGVKVAQAHGVRDPNAPLVEKLQAQGDHIKRLAETYLTRKEEAV